MPHLSCSIHLDTEHRNQQARSTSRHRLQHSCISRDKLRSIQRHLPALPSPQSGLLTNIRHHGRKGAHLATADARASISRRLPTQNGVLW
ncbi:MAG: hypothetical protein JWQ42_1346 [Edaphobacter sp.]|nr:hypothetical protein [Edaphobacter sp.]